MHKNKKLIPIEENNIITSTNIKSNGSFGGINMNTQNNRLTINKIKAKEDFECTKTLLENYRMIVWTLKFFSDNNNVITDTQSIQSTIRTCPQAKSLLQAINQAVKQIRYKPDDGEDMFEIINKAYIDKCKISNEKICEEMYISEAHFYRKKKLAIKLISERIWNSSHKDVDSWRKFVEALDDNRQRKKVS